VLTKIGADIVVEVPLAVSAGSPHSASVSDLIALPGGGWSVIWTVRDLDQLNPSTDFKFHSYGISAAAETTIFHSPQLLSARGFFALTSDSTFSVFSVISGVMELREFNAVGGPPVYGPSQSVPGSASFPVFGDAISTSGGKTLITYKAQVNGVDQLFARAFDADNAAGTEVQIGAASSGGQLARLTNGNFVVGVGTLADAGNIGGYIISEAGTKVVDLFAVNQRLPGSQDNVQLTALSTGGFVMTWCDHTGTGTGAAGDEVRARIFDNNGKAVSAELRVNAATAGNQNNVDVTALSGGRFAVSWETDLGFGQVLVKLYDRLGNAIGTDTVVAQSAQNNWFQSARLESLSDGKLLIAMTNDKQEEGIIAKIFDPGKTGTAGNDNLNGLVVGRIIEGLAGNDTLMGTGFADRIYGGSGNDTLIGGALNDILDGGLNNDILTGGLGIDTMTGGAGLDYFVFNVAVTAANADRITDFSPVYDTIRLENAVFKGLGTGVGVLAAAKFWSSTTGLAHDKDDRIIYETDTRKLYYDADGLGGAARVNFATLTLAAKLTNADFVVI